MWDFKGDTSLSKAYGLIRNLSKDVSLSPDRKRWGSRMTAGHRKRRAGNALSGCSKS